ncbi:MAG TPA: IS256 family transposase [Ktedonobacteraceae bacterium]|nr:IS256 family transposase [Ktedonobacteraceae bacterium]
MPVSKKKRTTSKPALSKSEPSSPLLPEQLEFQQHLRTLAQSAVRTVIELVMREELDAFIGAAWGECSPKRKGYRNGTYTRDLVTSTGRLEEIKVPRDREGLFHTQAFERYRRYEPHIAEGLTQMFVTGTSTHKVGEVAQTLLGVAPSASTISRLNQSLTNQFEAWRERRLQEHWRIVYLDGVHFSIRHGDQADSTLILTALGVDLEGNKEVLALRACAEEDKEGWASLLHDLRTRGATHIDLIVTDGHDGLLSAVSQLFSATPRQRCLVHKQRNVLNAIPRRELADVQAELVGIWEQPTKQEALTQLAAFKARYARRYPEAVRSLAEDEEHLLTFYAFPATMHRYIQSTNAIESLFSNVRQRTDQIDVFTTETSCLTIVWATIQDIRLHKISL